MKIVGIIQARVGSKRLPHKALLSLHGRPIIEWVVRRVRMARLLNDLVVAIPDTEENDVFLPLLEKLGVKVFKGPEDDVLMRFLLAARKHKATHIVRICADNPLVSGQTIDRLIDFYLWYPCVYAYDLGKLGGDVEMVPFSLLERVEQLATDLKYREHCFLFVRENPNRYSMGTPDYSDEEIERLGPNFDVDTFEDFRFLALKDFSIYDTPEDLAKLFKESD